jgi:hypothetical protein
MQEPIFMVKEEIIECLKRLGEELEKNFGFEEPVRILMIGGAYMITQIGNRAKTEDVDVLAYIDRHTDIYMKLRVAVSYVAVDMHVGVQWLSDGIGDLMQVAGEVPGGQLWLKHGMLEVYVPEPDYVLALKLLAGGRKKDIGDIQALFQMYGITNRKQARELLRKYFSKRALEVYAYQIRKTFSVLSF